MAKYTVDEIRPGMDRVTYLLATDSEEDPAVMVEVLDSGRRIFSYLAAPELDVDTKIMRRCAVVINSRRA